MGPDPSAKCARLCRRRWRKDASSSERRFQRSRVLDRSLIGGKSCDLKGTGGAGEHTFGNDVFVNRFVERGRLAVQLVLSQKQYKVLIS